MASFFFFFRENYMGYYERIVSSVVEHWLKYQRSRVRISYYSFYFYKRRDGE